MYLMPLPIPIFSGYLSLEKDLFFYAIVFLLCRLLFYARVCPYEKERPFLRLSMKGGFTCLRRH